MEVLHVPELADLLMLQLVRVGDAKDLGRGSCVCKALRSACKAERAWEVACKKQFCTAIIAHASLEGAAASAFSWRDHALERLRRPWNARLDRGRYTCTLATMALLLVDVWHGGDLVFSATLSPEADEWLEDECYSDSDDMDFDSEHKAEFAVANEVFGGPYNNRAPAFLGDGRLRASAWLLQRSGPCGGRLLRVMCRARAELDGAAEGSVAWAGSRCVVFEDAFSSSLPAGLLSLHLAGWLVEDKTGYRWWPQVEEPRPPQSDPRRLTRLSVRWKEEVPPGRLEGPDD